MNNQSSIENQKSLKYGRLAARLLIPVLWPVRFLIVLPVRRVYYAVVTRRYPARLRKARMQAAERSRKTGRKQFGIATGPYIKVWNRDQVIAQNKSFSKKLGKPFDWRKFLIFTCEDGRVIDK